MKIEHFALAFFVLVAATLLRADLSIRNTQAVNNKMIEYNRNVDSACDDAMHDMIEMVDDYSMNLNLESCKESFFNSLYASFGVLDSKAGQEDLQRYVPIILVTQNDGFYLLYHSLSDDEAETRMQWTQKYPYSYSGSVTDAGNKVHTYTINFTMGNEITVVDRSAVYGSAGSATFCGDYWKLGSTMSELYGALSNSAWSGAFLKNDDEFTRFRQSAMQYTVTKKADYYVNKHNEIAKAFGINFSFSLPVSSTDTFARTVDEVSVLAVFQGYPYGKGSKEVYSRFSVSGARLGKKSKYYVAEGGSGILYYHRGDCEKLRGKIWKKYNSKEDCAKTGAYPCPDCNP